jgi:hypothetical protein
MPLQRPLKGNFQPASKTKMARTTPDEAVPSTSRKQGAAGALAAAEPSARGRKQAGSRMQSRATAASGKRQQQQQQQQEEQQLEEPEFPEGSDTPEGSADSQGDEPSD